MRTNSVTIRPLLRTAVAALLAGVLMAIPAVVLAQRGATEQTEPTDRFDPAVEQDLIELPAFTPTPPLPDVIAARPGSDDVLDLRGCVAIALEYNDALRAERIKRDELRGTMNQALSTGMPTFDLYGEWSRGRDPSFALDESFGGGGGELAPPPGSDPWFEEWLAGFGSILPEASAIPAQNFVRANGTVSWTINPLKINGAVGGARLAIDRQEELIVGAEQTTTERVLGAYFQIIRTAAETGALEAQISNQGELLDLVRLRFDLGLATTLDTLQAAVNVANLEPQLRRVRKQLLNDGARLNALLGRRPENALSIRNEQPVELDPIDIEQALALAELRPDLVVQEYFIEILRRNRKVQKSEMTPYLTLVGSFGYVGKSFDKLFVDGHEAWRTAVGLTIPVFDGMLTRGLVQETDAQIRRAEAELLGRRREVRVEVLELMANLEAARDNLDSTALNLRRAEQTLAETMLMYQLGKANYLEVLVAEASRAQAQQNLIDVRYEVLTLTASFKRAVGYSPVLTLAQIMNTTGEVSE